jgi:hypothetical protein
LLAQLRWGLFASTKHFSEVRFVITFRVRRGLLVVKLIDQIVPIVKWVNGKEITVLSLNGFHLLLVVYANATNFILIESVSLIMMLFRRSTVSAARRSRSRIFFEWSDGTLRWAWLSSSGFDWLRFFFLFQ